MSVSPECTCSPPRSWTIDDVAAYLRIHRRTVIKMAAGGEIPCLRLGKLYRFDSVKIIAMFDRDAAGDQS